MIASKKQNQKKENTPTETTKLFLEDDIDKQFDDDEKSNYHYLNKFIKTTVNDIYKLCNNPKCVDAINKFFESDVSNRHNDLCYYIIPKEYINRNIDEEEYGLKLARIHTLRAFLSEKVVDFHDTINSISNDELSCKTVEKEYCAFLLDEVRYVINDYDSFKRDYGDDDDDYDFAKGELFDKINEYDLYNSSDGIDEINTLYLGLSGLSILDNCSLETFYTFVGMKQEEYNLNMLERLCEKYSIDCDRTINSISELNKSNCIDDRKYLMSHHNNVFYKLIASIINSKGKEDLTEILILFIHLSGTFSYNDSINCATRILNVYSKTEAAKVKAANYINGINISDDSVSIFDVDTMSGVEFEEFVGKIFEKLGYTTEITKASGDQGVDLIAKKDGKVLAIQAKCYSGVVGNHAIMEVVAGMKYYDCNCCMVVTNSTFTPAAKELATANNVELWDRNDLKEQMELLGV